MTGANLPPVKTPPIEAPTANTSIYLRSILGFGVWFVIGLAPFLGKARVPGFSALIDIYPIEMQNWLIPLSGLLMGMMAVTMEFVWGRKVARRRLSSAFVRTVQLFAVSFVLLVIVYVFTVARIGKSIAGGAEGTPESVSLAVVTGSRTVPALPADSECKCRPGQPARRCVGDIGLDPDNIETCFGSTRVALATLALAALYLALTGSFAAAVGLLLGLRRVGFRAT